ncbi:MAG: MarR family transcriptional regulator [Chloroflexi bacterium]|nr:MarR family transcriptional regulator [Chloroflexota bacterium]
MKKQTKITNIASAEYENEIWVLLYKTAYLIRRCREIELSRSDTSWIQSSVLYKIKNSPIPPTPADISRLLFRKPHTISGLLTRMEKQGLITKTKDEKKRNMVRILLTEKGEELLRISSNSPIIEEVMQNLSETKQKQLNSALQNLYTKATEIVIREPIVNDRQFLLKYYKKHSSNVMD